MHTISWDKNESRYSTQKLNYYGWFKWCFDIILSDDNEWHIIRSQDRDFQIEQVKGMNEWMAAEDQK